MVRQSSPPHQRRRQRRCPLHMKQPTRALTWPRSRTQHTRLWNKERAVATQSGAVVCVHGCASGCQQSNARCVLWQRLGQLRAAACLASGGPPTLHTTLLGQLVSGRAAELSHYGSLYMCVVSQR